MKIHITEGKRVPRPVHPVVSLSDEAYAALLAQSDKHNISMRKLASAIILEVCGELEVEKRGE